MLKKYFVFSVLLFFMAFRLFAFGIFDNSGYNNMSNNNNSNGKIEYEYKTEWADNVISGTSDSLEIKNIEIVGIMASVYVRTADVEKLEYKIEGLPENAVIIKSKGSDFYLLEKDLRRNNKKSRSWENIFALIEVVIPKKAMLDEIRITAHNDKLKVQDLKSKVVKIQSGIDDVFLKNIDCDKLKINLGISNAVLNNIKCKNFKLDCSTGDTEIENLEVLNQTSIDCSTSDLSIKNGYLNNPDIDLSGKFKFDGTFAGDVSLDGGISDVIINLTNSDKINSWDHDAGVGPCTIKNFKCKSFKLDLSTSKVLYENVKADSVDIESSTGYTSFKNCEFKNTVFELSTGCMDFSGLLKETTEIRASTGKVNFFIDDYEQNYFIELLKTSTPSITVNNSSGNFYGNKNAKNKILIHENYGNLNFEFKK